MSNDNPYSENPPASMPNAGIPGHPGPPPGMRQRSSFPLWLIICLAAIPMMCVCTGILAALLLPAVQAGREAARRMQCSNNMREIGLAMHNYHSAYGSFPPAYTVDDQGNPLHSWRTLILPFMEEQALYDSIDLTKPWNDPVNATQADTVVAAYQCPSSDLPGGRTTYVAVRGPDTILSGDVSTSIAEITDGTTGTIMLVEAGADHAVPWMSPDDISVDEFVAGRRSNVRHIHPGGGHALTADGAVHFISENADSGLREALATKSGGEAANLSR